MRNENKNKWKTKKIRTIRKVTAREQHFHRSNLTYKYKGCILYIYIWIIQAQLKKKKKKN